MSKIEKLLLVIVATLSIATIVNLAPVFETTASAKSVKVVTIPKKYRHKWHYQNQTITIRKRSARYAEGKTSDWYKITKGAFGKHSYDLYHKNYQGVAIKYVSQHKLHVLIDVTWVTFKR